MAIAFCGLLSGCGTPAAELVPVSGIVKIDGEPAANIRVQFTPTTTDESVNAPSSHGTTDAQGRFTLVTMVGNEEGAIEGSHRVTLFDREVDRPAQGEEPEYPPRIDKSFTVKGQVVKVVKGKEIVIEATGPY